MKAKLYINYSALGGFSLSRHITQADGYNHLDDLASLIGDAYKGIPGFCSADVESAKAAIEDGEFLASVDDGGDDLHAQTVIEDLHYAIQCWLEAEEERG